MLVLSRKKEEVIYIGNDIKVFVVDIQGDKVRLGFEAPDDVRILRSELVLRNCSTGKTNCDVTPERTEVDERIGK